MLAEGSKSVNTGKVYMAVSYKKRICCEKTRLDVDENGDTLIGRKRSANPFTFRPDGSRATHEP
jgi:hypothetical protein